MEKLLRSFSSTEYEEYNNEYQKSIEKEALDNSREGYLMLATDIYNKNLEKKKTYIESILYRDGKFIFPDNDNFDLIADTILLKDSSEKDILNIKGIGDKEKNFLDNLKTTELNKYIHQIYINYVNSGKIADISHKILYLLDTYGFNQYQFIFDIIQYGYFNDAASTLGYLYKNNSFNPYEFISTLIEDGYYEEGISLLGFLENNYNNKFDIDLFINEHLDFNNILTGESLFLYKKSLSKLSNMDIKEERIKYIINLDLNLDLSTNPGNLFLLILIQEKLKENYIINNIKNEK